MKRGMITLLAMLSLSALIAGGCANKEAIKSEEPIVKTDSAASDSTKPAQQPYFKTEENKTEPVKPAQEQQQSSTASSSSSAYGFETVYFDFDKSDLRKDARDSLNKNGELLLKSKKDAIIKIEGHCDERGSAEYNLALGERRAKSAQQYLLTLGVQPDRLSVISYGKEKPAVQGNDESAWAKNRRAEFVIPK
jgi:peptidoglycan-associated lipoprotein